MRDDTRTPGGNRFVSDQKDKIEARKAKHERLCAEARQQADDRGDVLRQPAAAAVGIALQGGGDKRQSERQGT